MTAHRKNLLRLDIDAPLVEEQDEEPCPHKHVLKDDDGRDRWFYVCDDCDKIVEPMDDGWEVVDEDR